MTVLVTGGAGFVAVTLIQRLLDAGHAVLAIDNLSRGLESHLAFAHNNPHFAFARVEMTDADAYLEAVRSHRQLGDITDVWHLAANSDIPAGIRDPGVDLRDTFMTTFNTLNVMEQIGARHLFFASSSAIYGDHGDAPLTETTGPLFPISNYGAMKLASEAAITAAAEKFLTRALIFRFPNVVGVPATHGVILDFITRLRAQPNRLDVLGAGTQQKAYLHVSDLVDAMLFIAENSREKVDAFNIGPIDSGVTVRWIAEQTVAAVTPGTSILFGTGDKGWVGDVPRFHYRIEKLQALGWTPTLDSAGAVQRAIWEIARQEGLA